MKYESSAAKTDRRLHNFMVLTVLLGIGGIIAGAVIAYNASQFHYGNYHRTSIYGGDFFTDMSESMGDIIETNEELINEIIHTIGFGIGVIIILISVFGICSSIMKYYSAALKAALIEEKFNILYSLIDKDTPTISCPNCGEKNSVYSHFCEKCGSNLHSNNIPSKICPDCGEENLVEAKFCANCGEEFPSPAPANKPKAHDIPKSKTKTASEDMAIPSDIIIPDATKEELLKAGIFSSDTSKPKTIKKEIPKNWKCPNCGKLNGQALTKCWGCKTPRP